jgi:hypothetical protein
VTSARSAAADAQVLIEPATVELLRDVSFQPALSDCDPERPGKGSWLMVAADGLARLVGVPAPAQGVGPLS